MPRFKIILIVCLLFTTSGCNETPGINNQKQTVSNIKTDTIPVQVSQKENGYEQIAKAIGLQEVTQKQDGIVVKMMYATTQNFTQTNLYGTFDKAYLLSMAVAKLKTANKILQQKFPKYTITIYDAARPVVVQQQLWDLAKIEPSKKHLYLSRPEQNSLHNYGAAVDVAILDSTGQMLDFGSPYDFFGEAAQPQLEPKLLKQGVLNLKQIANRKLLRSVMVQAGFTPIKTEWWQFNACTRSYSKQPYKLFQ